MQTIIKLLPYIRNYRWHIFGNIMSNIFMVFFSVVSIPMLIPFLQILLGQTVPPVEKPLLEMSASSITQYFNWYLGDLVTKSGSKEQALIFVCGCFVVLFFFKNLFRYLSLFFITPLRNGIVRDLRQSLFEKTLRLPLSYFSDERKGDLMSRVTSDVQEVEWSILNVLETLVREPLLIVGSLTMMIFISPPLTGFVFLLLGVTGVLIGGVGKSLKRQSGDLQGKLGNLVSVLDEALGGLRVVKGFNAENYQREKFLEVNNDFRTLLTKVLRRRDLASPMTEFLGVSVVCVLIWFSYKQVEAGTLSPQSFLAFLYAFFTVIDPAKAFSSAYYNIQKGNGAYARIEKILTAEELITDPQSTPPQYLADFSDKIEFRNVHFRYRTENEWILKNINLTLKKGKMLALVGASGAGKSTLADLVPRFYDVTEGAVLIDGINVKDLTLNNLREHLGIVTQEAVLFNDTIYNNIVFGYADASPEAVEAAAKAANAHSFIVDTEGGYQSNIGDRGMKLSGGQRQRLTIARALLRDPAILILDEATSALDSESERLVQAALSTLLVGRTSIVIAHRLSTVQHADEIAVMHKGEIIERGTHTELLALNGAYKKLVDMQGLS